MSLPAAAPGGHERQFFLDWLRVGALALLIVFHVGMYYVDWNYHVKSPYASKALAPWMMLSEPWRMSLLFLISGAATAYMLQAAPKNITVFLRRRSKQLLLPLLCGIFLIVPPQTYFEVRQKFNYSGNFWEFLQLYYAGAKAFCSGPDCLVMPTWNHLWFLPYLWFYTVLMTLVHRFAPQLLAAGVSSLQQHLQSYALLL
jgi:glucan biosynthesis protein C